MSVQTVLLDFSIDNEKINDESKCKEMTSSIKKILEEKYFSDLEIIYEIKTSDGFLCLLTKDNVIMNIRFFCGAEAGLITLNIEYFKKNDETPKINFDVRIFFSNF